VLVNGQAIHIEEHLRGMLLCAVCGGLVELRTAGIILFSTTQVLEVTSNTDAGLARVFGTRSEHYGRSGQELDDALV
jgi:hypothetical protein